MGMIKKDTKEYVPQIFDEPIKNIVMDTIKKNKQILIFFNNKKSCENTAEKLSKGSSLNSEKLTKISKEILDVLSSPTKQCKRLSECIEKGVAFHHAGLHSQQRSIIEREFASGTIKIICATPTLAMGVDLPAFRTLIKDIRRFESRTGMEFISVLEYQQLAGRAGRPGKEEYGESILIARDKNEKEELEERYIFGELEDITSKLAVEPVFRTYVLSLIAGGFINSDEKLKEFFSKTFYAHSFGNIKVIEEKIEVVIEKLEKWGFIETFSGKKDEFISGDRYKDMASNKIYPTILGKRISELYIDPITAHFILTNIKKTLNKKNKITELGILHLLSNSLEIKPLIRTRNSEIEEIEKDIKEKEDEFLVEIPEIYSVEYEDFLDSIKTTKLFDYWMNEKSEEYILEKLSVRPGEMQIKLEVIDWLLYSLYELAKIMRWREVMSIAKKIRIRMKYGVKEELLPLVRFKNIGRVRARKLYNNKIRNVKDVKETSLEKLSMVVGKNIAESMKKEVGLSSVKKEEEQKNL